MFLKWLYKVSRRFGGDSFVFMGAVVDLLVVLIVAQIAYGFIAR